MNIQYIGLNKKNFESQFIECSDISDPEDFDNFTFNFIDLNHELFWNKKAKIYSDPISNFINDFKTLSKLIKTSSSNILINLPQNLKTVYVLKDNIDRLEYSIDDLYSTDGYGLVFGKTYSKICDKKIPSDFVIKTRSMYGSPDWSVVTKSIGGNKPTTVRYKKIYVTTLNIENIEDLNFFMIETELINNEEDQMPEWMGEVKMFDDAKQLETIHIEELKISELETKIAEAQKRLSENDRLKSILYTQSDSLVEVVFEIFEEILDVDLSKFEDKKIEDISFTIGDKTFIGEIKGITSNVKTPNLSQLDNHYTNFVDGHPEIPEESIYKLLIINHQRKRPLSERDPIDHKQIELAENKYTSLIIETSELLELLERYRNESISKEEVIDLLTKNGLLKLN